MVHCKDSLTCNLLEDVEDFILIIFLNTSAFYLPPVKLSICERYIFPGYFKVRKKPFAVS